MEENLDWEWLLEEDSQDRGEVVRRVLLERYQRRQRPDGFIREAREHEHREYTGLGGYIHCD